MVGSGEGTIALSFTGEGALSYPLQRTVYLPDAPPAPRPELQLDLSFDRIQAQVGDPVRATVGATYRGAGHRDQVMVRVGLSPGFRPVTEELDAIVQSGRASRWEANDTHVSFYLMGLRPNQTRDLSFRSVPGLAMEAESPASEMYVYYENAIWTEVPGTRFVVTAP